MRFSVDDRSVFAATGGRAFDARFPAVVFLHGAGMDHTVWSMQARYLAHHGRAVLALDLPGHGGSEGPALPSIEAVADWVGRALDVLQVERAALVGHSMGALVALDAAARLAARVETVALLGAASRMPVHPDLLEAARKGQHAAANFVIGWGFGPVGHFGGNRAPGGWLMGSGTRLLEKALDQVLYTDLAACHGYEGGAAAARSLTCPTLVVAGAEDRMTPAKAGAKLAHSIAGARLVTIAGAGHMMMLETPDETLEALRSIL